ncbi:MCE family protein [Mycolicibacterium vanbaalenii]|uniref:MCE family protein n=1 Tax=Mycolicibacterium vanbaalenii TaxID=110539 RepID=UPI001F416FB8|nr:MCE family protein [Mycolicibacterium vanbaalenii]UJL26545.1 MCE family protein [Mycolicibacterium vanbaalenii]WND58641.1 MCE family protein [Mycolicibacterium vanbaalenii]
MKSRKWRAAMAICFAVLLVAGITVQMRLIGGLNRTYLVGYFDNSNGLFENDEIRILGVRVGRIADIEPQPERVKITFWVDDRYQVPADAKAAVIAPQLVTARAIQLTPAYTGGPTLADGDVIPQDRTAVPMEWDDLRQQLAKLTEALQPTEPGGVSTLGAFVDTAADNMRGQGADMRNTILMMSQAFSALGDRSDDMFSTIKNLAVVVSALQDSSALLRQLNGNLAAATAAMSSTPDAVGNALTDVDEIVDDTTAIIAENKEAMGTATDQLASVTTAVHESIDDVEQALHLFPNTLQNFVNIYQPTQQGITGALTMQNFANPISFLCGGIQAASRLNSEQSAKLCVQYLAPIIKNRQWNFPPLGANYVVGQAARPNELTYSEDRLRPDFRPTPAPALPDPGPAAQSTDPAAGLPGMMIPGGGS